MDCLAIALKVNISKTLRRSGTQLGRCDLKAIRYPVGTLRPQGDQVPSWDAATLDDQVPSWDAETLRRSGTQLGRCDLKAIRYPVGTLRPQGDQVPSWDAATLKLMDCLAIALKVNINCFLMD